MKEICGWRYEYTHNMHKHTHTIPYQAQAGKGSHNWRCLHDQAKAKKERISIMVQAWDTGSPVQLTPAILELLGCSGLLSVLFLSFRS